MRCADVMRRELPVVTRDDTAERVARIMRDENVGFVPVVSDEETRRLVGVVTDRDLTIAVVARNREPRSVPIAEVMTAEAITAAPEEELAEVERKMALAEIRRVPVVDDGVVVGVVSLHDLAQLEPRETLGEVFREVSKTSAQNI
jgi:CBS domain-containing protein